MQKSAQHSSHCYQDVQRMLPLISGNSLGWRIYRAPHLPSGSVQFSPGWAVVALERSRGMVTCQREGFLKQDDVEVHCQSDLPLWWIQLCTGFLQSLSVPPLHSVLPGRFAQHSLGHQPVSWPQFPSTGEAFCGCRWSSVYNKKTSLEKHSEVLLHSQVIWSKCPAIQKHIPGKSVV